MLHLLAALMASTAIMGQREHRSSVFWSTLPIAAADTGMTQEYSTCLEKSNGVTIEMITR